MRPRRENEAEGVFCGTGHEGLWGEGKSRETPAVGIARIRRAFPGLIGGVPFPSEKSIEILCDRPEIQKLGITMALAAEARAWLADLWSPVVMVMASPELDNICLESNGLRFVDILRPFGPLPSLNGDAGGARALVP